MTVITQVAGGRVVLVGSGRTLHMLLDSRVHGTAPQFMCNVRPDPTNIPVECDD